MRRRRKLPAAAALKQPTLCLNFKLKAKTAIPMVAMPSLTAVDSPTFLQIISKTHSAGRKKLFADCSDRTKAEKTCVLAGPQVATSPGEGGVSVLKGKEESFPISMYSY